MKKVSFLLLFFITMMFSLEAVEEDFMINLPFYKETEHFEFFCNAQDREVSAVIVQNLEQRFEAIASRYRFIPGSRIRVGIYPDSKSFHEAIGQPQASEWINEFWGDGLMMMVSPNASHPVHSYTSLAVLAPIDSFVGSILQGRYAQAPVWLHVGVPLYESGRWIVEEKEIGKKIIQEHIERKGFPEFEDLENNAHFNENRMSPFTATLVAFIVQTKGFDTLLGILEEYSRFEEIMDQSKASLRDDWIEFLSNKYLKDAA